MLLIVLPFCHLLFAIGHTRLRRQFHASVAVFQPNSDPVPSSL